MKELTYSALPSELVQMIGAKFCEDPMSYFSLQATCTRMSQYLNKPFDLIVKHKHLPLYLRRLVWRLKIYNNVELKTNPTVKRYSTITTDRYIYFYPSGRLDKVTGILMDAHTTTNVRGTIWESTLNDSFIGTTPTMVLSMLRYCTW